MRAFVAIFPAPHVLVSLAAVRNAWPANDSIRWVPDPQVHLTLQFLGNISGGQVDELSKNFHALSREIPVFDLRAAGIGCFPNLNRPRILWAGIEGDSNRLRALRHRAESIAASAGIAREARTFHPHLTLARLAELNFRKAMSVRKHVEVCGSNDFGPWKLTAFYLMRSVLSSAGSRYERVASFALSPGEACGGDC